MRHIARKTKQVIAFAMAFALLSVPVVQAAAGCNGSCHGAVFYNPVGEAEVARRLHSRGIHSHSIYASPLLNPIPQASSWDAVDWIGSFKAKMGSSACTSASLRSLVALHRFNPEVTRGHRLLTLSQIFQPFKIESGQYVNCRIEAALRATANPAYPTLFLKNRTLLI
jgi:hypothetical protein